MADRPLDMPMSYTHPRFIRPQGHGSGLNADLLDGKHGGEFVQTGHTHVEADITDLDHTDVDAVHINVTGEIHSVGEKLAPVNADEVLIEDSADGYSKKRVQVGNLPSAAGVTDHGALTGLGDDDHSQYHNDARGDARYVNITGDTVTGDLAVDGGHFSVGGPVSGAGMLTLNGTTTEQLLRITGTVNGPFAMNFSPTINQSAQCVRCVPAFFPNASGGFIYVLNMSPIVAGSSSYNISAIHGFFTRPVFQQTYSGTVTYCIGVKVNSLLDQTTGPHPTILNQYGVSVAQLSGATNNWAIHTEGNTPSYFGGSVGIGVLAPVQKLHVSTSDAAVAARIESTNALGNSAVQLKSGAGQWNLRLRGADAGFDILEPLGGTVPFLIESGAPTDTVYVDSSGDVGIGTGSPADKLDVNGVVRSNVRGVKARQTDTVASSIGVFSFVNFVVSEDWDTDSFHSLVTNSTRFTVPTGKGGKYRVTIHTLWDAYMDDLARLIIVRKNGSTFLYDLACYVRNTNDGTIPVSFGVSALVDLAAGDYLEMGVSQNSGASQNFDATFEMTYEGQ